jgi:ABC-type uncharacterized transport system permease subunit
MIQFDEVFADEVIVSTLWRLLSWSYFKEIIYGRIAGSYRCAKGVRHAVVIKVQTLTFN